MSSPLITLQDHDVRVLTPDDLLARSPGFAHIAAAAPVFGEAARQQARLHPRQSFNQFWAQLSLDPLPVKNKYFRHTADLAHGHLLSLGTALPRQLASVIAVPSHYTRSQLGVLLGLLRSTNIPVNGLVDFALLQAMASDAQAESCIIVDLQLHQTVLAQFRRVDGQMQRERVLQVPASGLLSLQDAWTNFIADEFIRQTRFDPKHNAEVEQYLYNQLDGWLTTLQTRHELVIDLDHKGVLHQAQIRSEGFAQRARPVFERIRKELDQLRTPDTAIHILRSQLQLPGLTAVLDGIEGLDDERLLDSFITHGDRIRSNPEQLQHVTRLPLQVSTGQGRSKSSVRQPTHVLAGARAVPLPQGRLVFGTAAGTDAARVLPLAGLAPGSALVLHRTRTQLLLELQDLDSARVNDAAVNSGIALQLGDRIDAGNGAALLHLIEVE